MAQYHEYPALQYTVQTDDGYILTLHRIPGSRKSDTLDALAKSWMRPAVLFNHGIVSDSTAGLFPGYKYPGKSLFY